MHPAGIIELGANPTHKKAFYNVVKLLITGEDRNFVYVEPRIRARVKMRNWTLGWDVAKSGVYGIYFLIHTF